MNSTTPIISQILPVRLNILFIWSIPSDIKPLISGFAVEHINHRVIISQHEVIKIMKSHRLVKPKRRKRRFKENGKHFIQKDHFR